MAKAKDPAVVDATAEKRFFIDMLTKDIELLPAIADLVDNSVDGARAVAGHELTGRWVRLVVAADKFEISDNAGGISADIARNYAFRFGRPRAFKGTPGSVGQFGIGMKRAIFKLGSHFVVESTFSANEKGRGSRFSIDENVEDWASRPDDWTFTFRTLEEGVDVPASDDSGTVIVVDDLHPSVSDDLADNAVIQQLKIDLSTRHQRSIQQGLELSVNGEVLSANAPSLQYSGDLVPLNRKFTVPGENADVVVQLVAGIVPAQANSGGDDGDAQSFQSPGSAGWYVFCNDRLLLAADKTAITGWGFPAAAYHPQYRNFRGYVYMQANDAGDLPWNTTKTAVDRDHPVFRAVASEMKKALVEVQAGINRMKTENARWTEAKEDAEARGDAPPQPTPLQTAVESAPAVPVEALPESAAFSAPQPTSFPPKIKPSPTIQRIQYEVEKERYEKLSEVFGTRTGSELGRKTFEYVWKSEVD